jgi:hypothetical protein
MAGDGPSAERTLPRRLSAGPALGLNFLADGPLDLQTQKKALQDLGTVRCIDEPEGAA